MSSSARKGALGEIRRRVFMLVVRLLDIRKLDVRLDSALAAYRHAAGTGRHQRTAEIALSIHGNVAAQSDLLADVPEEVLHFAQRAVDTRRGDLQRIRSGDRLLDVEQHGKRAAETLQSFEVHS